MTQHAQTAEHKYSRPHARLFRLRFARVVGVFPVCSPATLNLKTAKALGLTIPESFLLRADEVIE
jgi:hypothetical protein